MRALPETDVADFDAVAAEAAVVDAVTAEANAAKGAASTAHCPNCGASSTGHFCANCGQKAAPIAPTLGYFLHELAHEALNFDGKIFRSLRLLLTEPGFLTREIFAGRRASYVAPLRLYLIASVVYFALTAAFPSSNPPILKYTADPGETIDPATIELVAEANRTLDAALGVWIPRAMFLLVPLFAALTMALRRRGGFTYPQHLYFALHVHAMWFFAGSLSLLVSQAPLSYAAPVAGSFHALYAVTWFFVAFRRVYGTTAWGTLCRTTTVAFLYLLSVLAAVAAIAAPTVLPFFGLPP